MTIPVIDAQYLLASDVDAHRALVESHMTQMRLVLEALEKAKQEPTPFTIRAFVPPALVANPPAPPLAAPLRITSAHRGIIQFVHNPTPYATNVVLSFGGSLEETYLNLLLSEYSAMNVKLAFHSPVYVVSGNAIISGEYYA
ncbi:MAG: hypothetical protein NVSMB19_16010 [Vulcanimicrobiaceae bacterium]